MAADLVLASTASDTACHDKWTWEACSSMYWREPCDDEYWRYADTEKGWVYTKDYEDENEN